MREHDLTMLAPVAREKFEELATRLRLETMFLPFETYRAPEDQDLAYRRGTSKAKAFQSPHQFGLAVDFVPFVDGNWTWANSTGPAAELHRIVGDIDGLVCPIPWDPFHVEHIAWDKLKRVIGASKP